MENHQFDKYLREKLDKLDPDFNPDHWKLFEGVLDAEKAVDSFDELAREKLNNLEPALEPGHWALMEQMMDASELSEEPSDQLIDEIAYNQLSQLSPPYNPAHWNKMAYRLNQEALVRKVVYRYKVAEVSLFLLILLTFLQFLPTYSPTAPLQLAEQELFNSTEQIAAVQKTDNTALAAVAHQETTPKKVDSEAPIANLNQQNLPPVPPASSSPAPAFKTPTPLIAHTLAKSLDGPRSLAKTFSPGLKAQKLIAPLGTTPLQNGLAINNAEGLLASTMLPTRNITPLFGNTTPSKAVLPGCKDCDQLQLRSRLSIGMFAAADINYVMTPFNTKFTIPAYDQFYAGYGGGISLTYQIKRWSVEIGGIYSALFYQPENLLLDVSAGSVQSGYYGKGFRSARLDVIKVPVNLRYQFTNFRKWNVYVLTGSTINTAVYKHFEIVRQQLEDPSGGVPRAPVRPPLPGETTTTQDQAPYKGFFENGRLKDNIYFTANLGLGVERYFNQRWSLFIQPVYQHQFLSNGDGFGPNKDRLNTFSTYIGVRRSLLK